MKTELKFVTITYFLVLAVSEIMQSTVYITRLHLIYSPLKSLAEAGSLVTSLIRLPQTILSIKLGRKKEKFKTSFLGLPVGVTRLPASARDLRGL